MDEFIHNQLKKNVLVLDLNKFIETYKLFPAIASEDYMINEMARAQNILPIHPKSSLASFFEGQIPHINEIFPKENKVDVFEYNPVVGLYLPRAESEDLGVETSEEIVVDEPLIVASKSKPLISDNVYKLEDRLALRSPQVSYSVPAYNLGNASQLYEFISRANDNYLSGRTFNENGVADGYYRLRKLG